MKSSSAVTKIRKTVEWVAVILFLIGIAMPMIGMAIGGNSPRSESGASSSSYPKLSVTWPSMISFPLRYKAYFQDNFGFRHSLIRWHGIVMLRLLGSASSKVIPGTHNWLYYAGEQSVDGIRRTQPLTGKDLLGWKKAIESHDRWLAGQGARYLVVIVPDKHTIYPEYLPSSYAPIRKDSRLDQFMRYMSTNCSVPVLDLRDVLMDEKKHGVIYYRTDTHWNSAGAFAGYQAIIGEVRAWYPSLRCRQESDYRITRSKVKGGDLARMLGLKDVLDDEDVVFVPKQPRHARIVGKGSLDKWPTKDIVAQPKVITECPDGEIPRVVMLRDSMASALLPFLSEHFAKATYTWTDPRDVPVEVIKREHPSLVIQEIVERRLLLDVPSPLRTPKLAEPAPDAKRK
jgi:alginate O-acetyltransferase complex protein AlgJ